MRPERKVEVIRWTTLLSDPRLHDSLTAVVISVIKFCAEASCDHVATPTGAGPSVIPLAKVLTCRISKLFQRDARPDAIIGRGISLLGIEARSSEEDQV